MTIPADLDLVALADAAWLLSMFATLYDAAGRPSKAERLVEHLVQVLEIRGEKLEVAPAGHS